MQIKTFLIAAAATVVGVRANTPLTDAFVRNDVEKNGGFEIAFAARPIWHFGKSLGNLPCYPTRALDLNGQQHGNKPDYFPRAGTGCPNPGPGGPGASFPTYYTVNYCGGDEIRVVYSLYFQHDGFTPALIARGHMHDWERIIVIWKRNPTTNLWTRSTLLRSYHTGYMANAWGSIQNTIDYSNPAEQGGKNKDGAKIYVGWGKHAMFDTRNTKWNDEPSQGCEREFRSADWWYLPGSGRGEGDGGLVRSGKGTVEGDAMAKFNWGNADSGPWVVEDRVCTEKEGGYVSCNLGN